MTLKPTKNLVLTIPTSNAGQPKLRWYPNYTNIYSSDIDDPIRHAHRQLLAAHLKTETQVGSADTTYIAGLIAQYTTNADNLISQMMSMHENDSMTADEINTHSSRLTQVAPYLDETIRALLRGNHISKPK